MNNDKITEAQSRLAGVCITCGVIPELDGTISVTLSDGSGKFIKDPIMENGQCWRCLFNLSNEISQQGFFRN